MQLKEIYDIHKDKLLFDNSIYIKNLKRKLINNFNLNPKILKNNESVKHIDQSIINNLNYIFHYDNSKILFKNNQDNNFSSLLLKNGNLNSVENIDQKNISIKVLGENLDLAENKIRKYENAFFDDYLVNLNSVLMNSGYDFELKENTSSKIIISNQIDVSNTTIYAKNFFTVKENSKLVIIEKFFNNLDSNSNIINFFQVEKNAEVIHLIIQDNEIKSNLQLSSHANCMQDSKYQQIIFNTSKSSIRNHHYANLLGTNANAKLEGVFFGCGDQIVDTK